MPCISISLDCNLLFSPWAKALWAVKWLFCVWKPPVIMTFSNSFCYEPTCAICPAHISNSHLTEKPDPELFQLPEQVQKPPDQHYSRSSFIQSQRTINPSFKFIMVSPARQNAATAEHVFNGLWCGRTPHGACLTIWEIDEHSKLPGKSMAQKKGFGR